MYSVFATFAFSTDCESCRRPISTNPGSLEAGEYELTRGLCFVARRLDVDGFGRRAVVDFVVCFGRGGISFFSRFFFFERTRPAASMRPPYLIYLSTSTLHRF